MTRILALVLALVAIAAACLPALAATGAALDPTTAAIHALAPLLVAPLASLLATAAERAPAIPYQGQTRAGIVLALSLAALVLRVALAWATGTLAAVDWTEAAKLLIEALTAALVAAGGYALAWRRGGAA